MKITKTKASRVGCGGLATNPAGHALPTCMPTDALDGLDVNDPELRAALLSAGPTTCGADSGPAIVRAGAALLIGCNNWIHASAADCGQCARTHADHQPEGT